MNDMILAAIMILLVFFAGSVESNLRKAFRGDWMRFDDPQKPNATEMDNSEYDYGHNVKYNSEE